MVYLDSNSMKFFLPILICFLVSVSTPLYAADTASVSINAPAKVEINKNFSIVVDVQPKGEAINSFDITMSYPSENVSFEGYTEEKSIKKIWINSPTSNLNTIHFSGIIPGGVDGVYDPDKKDLQAIPVAYLLFKTTKLGSGMFSIRNSNILKNDGLGTSLTHERNNATVVIIDQNNSGPAKAYITHEEGDTKRPEPLSIQFIDASMLARTPSMVMFTTTDIDSGVAKYQLKTGANTWLDITSPFPVSKQLLAHTITVRVVDFSGNVREGTTTIPGLLSIEQLLLILFALCLMIGIIIIKRKQ